MNPDRFLGLDPTPGDLRAADEVTKVLRSCVVALSEGRRRVEHTARPDGLWQGAHAAAIVDTLTAYAGRLRALEDAVVDFLQAWQQWRHGIAGRQDETAALVEAVTQLVDGPVDSADPRREALLRQAGALRDRHQIAADQTGAAAEALIAATTVDQEGRNLPVDLQRGLLALEAAVEQWLAESAADLRRATETISSVTELTAVVPQLVGVAPGSDASPEALRIAAAAPGSHRLITALHRGTPERPAEELSDASFASEVRAEGALADRVRGAPHAGDLEGETA